MFEVCHYNNNLILFYQVKQPIISKPISIISFKFTFELFDIRAKVGV